jgi:hypothetical protein
VDSPDRRSAGSTRSALLCRLGYETASRLIPRPWQGTRSRYIVDSRRAITSVHRRAVLGFYPPRQAWRYRRQFPSPCSPYRSLFRHALRSSSHDDDLWPHSARYRRQLPSPCSPSLSLFSQARRSSSQCPPRPIRTPPGPISTDCAKTDVGRTEIARAAAITRVRMCIDVLPWPDYRTSGCHKGNRPPLPRDWAAQSGPVIIGRTFSCPSAGNNGKARPEPRRLNRGTGDRATQVILFGNLISGAHSPPRIAKRRIKKPARSRGGLFMQLCLGWSEAFTCPETSISYQALSFARQFAAPWNHFADQKFCTRGRAAPKRESHGSHQRISGQGIRVVVPGRGRERSGTASRHAPICPHVDEPVGTDVQYAVRLRVTQVSCLGEKPDDPLSARCGPNSGDAT